MRDTPRRRLRARALRGAWREFPVDPAEAYEALVVFVDEADRIGKGGTFELAQALDDEIARRWTPSAAALPGCSRCAVRR